METQFYLKKKKEVATIKIMMVTSQGKEFLITFHFLSVFIITIH
jgi:hypothetical protein